MDKIRYTVRHNYDDPTLDQTFNNTTGVEFPRRIYSKTSFEILHEAQKWDNFDTKNIVPKDLTNMTSAKLYIKLDDSVFIPTEISTGTIEGFSSDGKVLFVVDKDVIQDSLAQYTTQTNPTPIVIYFVIESSDGAKFSLETLVQVMDIDREGSNEASTVTANDIGYTPDQSAKWTSRYISSPTGVKEALDKIARINGTDMGSIVSSISTPPVTPNDGDKYRVVATATGSWLGLEDSLQEWNSNINAWLSHTPREGDEIFDNNTSVKLRYQGGTWVADNLFSDTEQAKLSGIEDNATADQTSGEIKTLYESNADTNAFTDAEQTKLGFITATSAIDLDGIEDNATNSKFLENGLVLVDYPKGASYSSSTNVTGAIKITLPFTSFPSDMFDLELNIAEFSNTGKMYKLNIGAYAHLGSTDFIYSRATSIFGGSLRVRMGQDASNNLCIIVGDVGDVWEIPHINVSNLKVHFSTPDLSVWREGWDISIETDVTTGYTLGATNINSTFNRDLDFVGYAPTGTTQTLDMRATRNHSIDLGSATGNVTLTLDNPIEGVLYTIILIQGATARNVIFPAHFPGGTSPNTLTVTATNNAIDMVQLIYNGTVFLRTSLNQNLG